MAASRTSLASLAAAASVALAAPAAAEPALAVGATRPPPGHGAVQLIDERSLTVGQVGAAWALGLDAVVGVTPDLAIGVSHSAAALGEPRDGGGVCIDSTAHDCAGLYAGGFVDARWRVPGAAALTGVVRLGVGAAWSPLLRLGVVARGAERHLWWRIAPEVAVALDRADGDRDALGVPAWLGVDLGAGSAWLATGVRGELTGFADALVVPLAAGVEGRYRGAAIGLSAGYPQLLGRHASTRVRALAWWIGWGW
ncbi:MAG: hypothetical protein JNK64_22090 [Myxococcales bacterium]|nr:hypothetical protein [Myxococcales bacterium]